VHVVNVQDTVYIVFVEGAVYNVHLGYSLRNLCTVNIVNMQCTLLFLLYMMPSKRQKVTLIIVNCSYREAIPLIVIINYDTDRQA
jgi:uncharacterized protein YcbK (DUF882 family)